MGNLYRKFDHFFFLKPNWSKGLGPFDFLILNAWITKAICRLISWKYEIFSNMNNPILLGIWKNRTYLKNSKWNVSKCQMTPPCFLEKIGQGGVIWNECPWYFMDFFMFEQQCDWCNKYSCMNCGKFVQGNRLFWFCTSTGCEQGYMCNQTSLE